MTAFSSGVTAVITINAFFVHHTIRTLPHPNISHSLSVQPVSIAWLCGLHANFLLFFCVADFLSDGSL